MIFLRFSINKLLRIEARNMAENGNGASQTASLGFEAKLFLAADKLRGSMDPASISMLHLALCS